MTRPQPARVRVQDWPERLAAFIEGRRHAPFAWGTHDCAMFGGSAIEAQIGTDPFAAFRGRYTTEEEADAITSPAGGFEALLAATLAEFGAAECPPALAQRGDVGMVRVGNTEALGVIMGGLVAVPGPDRLAFVPPSRIYRAWAI
jgi:hypothetical protein